MPTSITTAPSRTCSGPIIPARPTAATRTSASRHTAARSRVREWQTVTVACSRRSSAAIGLPTIWLRPTTTARRPASGMPLRRSSSRIPAGVAGTGPGSSSHRRPTLTGWKPSTSLAGSTSSSRRRSGRPAGSGSCTRMPSTAGSAFRARRAAATSSAATEAGSSTVRPSIPTSRQARVLLAT